MRIAFRVDYGEQIGMGHLTRMKALADAFIKLFSAEVSFYHTQDEPVDYTPYDLIVLDSYLLSDDYIAKLHDSSHTLVCYDDNALYTYDCDVLLNANLHASKLTFRTAFPPPKKLLGGSYSLLRPQFWHENPVRIRRNPSSAFICFGGTDFNNQTIPTVRALKLIPGLHLYVVLGKSSFANTDFSDIRGDNVSFFGDPLSIAAIMRQCDIAVISAGSIVYEVAALGIPSLTITQAENQRLVAQYFDAHKLVKNLGWHEDLDQFTLRKQTLDLLLDYNRRMQESSQLVLTVSKQGALNAARAIRKVMDEPIR